MSWKAHYEQQAEAWRTLAQCRADKGNPSSAQMAKDIAVVYENLAKEAQGDN